MGKKKSRSIAERLRGRAGERGEGESRLLPSIISGSSSVVQHARESDCKCSAIEAVARQAGLTTQSATFGAGLLVSPADAGDLDPGERASVYRNENAALPCHILQVTTVTAGMLRITAKSSRRGLN